MSDKKVMKSKWVAIPHYRFRLTTGKKIEPNKEVQKWLDAVALELEIPVWKRAYIEGVFGVDDPKK